MKTKFHMVFIKTIEGSSYETYPLIIFVVAFILFANGAFADFMTGKDLLRNISKGISDDKNDLRDYAMAWGYIIGVCDAYNEINFFVPDKLTREQIRDIAVKYLKENPEILDKPADLILSEAFHKAFGKKKK